MRNRAFWSRFTTLGSAIIAQIEHTAARLDQLPVELIVRESSC